VENQAEHRKLLLCKITPSAELGDKKEEGESKHAKESEAGGEVGSQEKEGKKYSKEREETRSYCHKARLKVEDLKK